MMNLICLINIKQNRCRDLYCVSKFSATVIKYPRTTKDQFHRCSNFSPWQALSTVFKPVVRESIMALEHGKTLGIVLLELSGDRGKGTCQNASFQCIVLPSISPYLIITQSARNTQWNNIVIKSHDSSKTLHCFNGKSIEHQFWGNNI